MELCEQRSIRSDYPKLSKTLAVTWKCKRRTATAEAVGRPARRLLQQFGRRQRWPRLELQQHRKGEMARLGRYFEDGS